MLSLLSLYKTWNSNTYSAELLFNLHGSWWTIFIVRLSVLLKSASNVILLALTWAFKSQISIWSISHPNEFQSTLHCSCILKPFHTVCNLLLLHRFLYVKMCSLIVLCERNFCELTNWFPYALILVRCTM